MVSQLIPYDKLVLAEDIRISADAVSDEELLASIQEYGIRTSLLVRQRPKQPEKYEIWDGRRRFRVGRIAGVAMFPCDVREMDDQEAHLMAFVLNNQRQEMSPFEEGLWILKMMEKFPETTQGEWAKKMGHSDSWLSRRIAAASQYRATSEEDREALPRTERAMRELRKYTPEEQEEILAQARLTGVPPTATELMRRSKANMTSREVLERWQHQDSEFIIHMLQEEAGLTATDAADILAKFRAKRLPWQGVLPKFTMPGKSDPVVNLYAQLTQWYPIEVIDFVENNLGSAVSIETWRRRLVRFMRKMFEKTGEQTRQAVLEEFKT
uniref:ParB-like N-terminal domain-containing protein n=1 Tax=viral metagenome TaxID=1070528 RepID=A0A6M3M0Z3_9ZZZZ